MFSTRVGIKDSNEAEVLAILKALPIFHTSFHHYLFVESDLANAISWVKSLRGPWKMQFLFNEISHLISNLQVTFQHIRRSANGTANCLAKRGVHRSCNLSASIM